MNLSYYLLTLSLLAFWGCNSTSTQTDSSDAGDKKPDHLETISDTAHHQKLPQKNPPYILTRGQVGPIKIGMPLTEVKKIIFKENITEVVNTQKGQEKKGYEIRLDPDAQTPDLLIEENCKPTCQVWRMLIKSPVIKTPEGLGIGSTLGEVKRFYKIDFIQSDDTNVIAVSQKLKISFFLDKQKISSKTNSPLTVSNTPDEVKVIGMYIL